MIAIAIVGFPIYTRLVRGIVLSVRGREFVEAARALGSPDRLILVRHIVPQLISPVIVAFSLDVGAKILATAGLSFLGLGTQPPTADWGSMLATGRQFVILSPHVVLLPGLAIFVDRAGAQPGRRRPARSPRPADVFALSRRTSRSGIEELARDPELAGKPLVGELTGYRTIRAAGQRYRIIYRVERRLVTILIVAVGRRKEGDRKDIYELARRLLRQRLLDR